MTSPALDWFRQLAGHLGQLEVPHPRRVALLEFFGTLLELSPSHRVEGLRAPDPSTSPARLVAGYLAQAPFPETGPFRDGQLLLEELFQPARAPSPAHCPSCRGSVPYPVRELYRLPFARGLSLIEGVSIAAIYCSACSSVFEVRDQLGRFRQTRSIRTLLSGTLIDEIALQIAQADSTLEGVLRWIPPPTQWEFWIVQRIPSLAKALSRRQDLFETVPEQALLAALHRPEGFQGLDLCADPALLSLPPVPQALLLEALEGEGEVRTRAWLNPELPCDALEELPQDLGVPATESLLSRLDLGEKTLKRLAQRAPWSKVAEVARHPESGTPVLEALRARRHALWGGPRFSGIQLHVRYLSGALDAGPFETELPRLVKASVEAFPWPSSQTRSSSFPLRFLSPERAILHAGSPEDSTLRIWLERLQDRLAETLPAEVTWIEIPPDQSGYRLLQRSPGGNSRVLEGHLSDPRGAHLESSWVGFEVSSAELDLAFPDCPAKAQLPRLDQAEVPSPVEEVSIQE